MLPEYATLLASFEILIFILMFLGFEFGTKESAAKGAQLGLFFRRYSTYTYTMFAFSNLIDLFLVALFSINTRG